jgi:hypothetical protein
VYTRVVAKTKKLKLREKERGAIPYGKDDVAFGAFLEELEDRKSVV